MLGCILRTFSMIERLLAYPVPEVPERDREYILVLGAFLVILTVLTLCRLQARCPPPSKKVVHQGAESTSDSPGLLIDQRLPVFWPCHQSSAPYNATACTWILRTGPGAKPCLRHSILILGSAFRAFHVW